MPPALRPLAFALAVAALAAAGLADAATVRGKATFDGPAPRLPAFNMAADPDCAAQHPGAVASDVLVLGPGGALANVFVQVKNPPPGGPPPPAEPVVIDQHGCLYRPKVVGVRAGQKIVFRNSDGLLHNVHGLPEVNDEFNFGMPPRLLEKPTVFDRPEPAFPIKCDLHPWMRAYVAVMSHPYFAVTGADGTFSLPALPAGTWQLEAWHEKLGTRTASVTVAAGEAQAVAFSFAAPKP